MAGVALASLLGAGMFLQAGAAATGGWDIGQNQLPAAWPLVESHGTPSSRVLWIGAAERRPFPAPGGDPQGLVSGTGATLRYAVTDRDGVSSLDTGRDASGPGYSYVRRVMTLVLSGTTHHAGALLAPTGIRDVIAQAGDLPGSAVTALDSQLDLNAIPAGGLIIYRVADPLPPASVVAADGFARASRDSDLLDLVSQPGPDAKPLQPVTGGWRGSSDGAGLVLIADQFTDGWRLAASGGEEGPKQAFGWATGFPAPRGAFSVTYAQQWVRTTEVALLAILWAGALWITRKRVDR